MSRHRIIADPTTPHPTAPAPVQEQPHAHPERYQNLEYQIQQEGWLVAAPHPSPDQSTRDPYAESLPAKPPGNALQAGMPDAEPRESVSKPAEDAARPQP